MSQRATIAALAVIGLLAVATPHGRESPGTPEERAALFDEILTKTYAWTAFTPHNDVEATYRTTVAPLRQVFADASTDAALYYAIVRLSNLRRDRHLEVGLVEGGLQVGRYALQAPVTFATDYGTPGRYALFVSDHDVRIGELANGVTPEVGDRLLEVNGIGVDDYAARLTPYCRYSTADKLWWEIAALVTRKTTEVGPEHYAADVTYRLERRDGSTYVLEGALPRPGHPDLARLQHEALSRLPEGARHSVLYPLCAHP